MKKRILNIILVVVLSAVLIFGLVSCKKDEEPPIGNDGMAILKYPDFPQTPDAENSWNYIEEGTDLTIDWYIDVATWGIPTAINKVSEQIKKATGITIKFTNPVLDDGQMLSTIIASGDLPDVMSVPTSNTAKLSALAVQGYVYDINTLAQKWAPSLSKNLPKDVMDWWAYGNNKTYGIPNHYYSYEDIPQTKMQPNGGMMVREDIFNAWQNYAKNNLANNKGMIDYTSISGISKSVEWQGFITTPEGFKQAAKWAMQNYSDINNNGISAGLQLSQFKADGNTSLKWLAQFFAVPFEDKNGDYVYQFTSQQYAEMLYYLNDLYNEGIISKANFTNNYDGIGSVIAGGKAFATIVTPQDYQIHFNTAKDEGHKYISMYITNEKGDAPVLQDIRGYGFLFNMITTDCKRPDLVIKLFDYLCSDEGQRLVSMGPEGITWNWADESKTEIVYTEQYLKDKIAGTTAQYGQLKYDMLINWQYYDNIQPKVNHGKTDAEVFMTNLKRPLSIYSYDYNATAFIVDTTNKKYKTYANNLIRIDSTIATQLPKIIKAANRAEAKAMYEQTIKAVNDRGLQMVIEMNAVAYQKIKVKLGVTVAWPPYMKDYDMKPDRLNPNGDLTLYRPY